MKLKRAAAIFFAGILLASEAVIPVFADTANTLYAPNNDGNSDVEEQGSVNVEDSRSAIGVQAEALRHVPKVSATVGENVSATIKTEENDTPSGTSIGISNKASNELPQQLFATRNTPKAEGQETGLTVSSTVDVKGNVTSGGGSEAYGVQNSAYAEKAEDSAVTTTNVGGGINVTGSSEAYGVASGAISEGAKTTVKITEGLEVNSGFAVGISLNNSNNQEVSYPFIGTNSVTVGKDVTVTGNVEAVGIEAFEGSNNVDIGGKLTVTGGEEATGIDAKSNGDTISITVAKGIEVSGDYVTGIETSTRNNGELNIYVKEGGVTATSNLDMAMAAALQHTIKSGTLNASVIGDVKSNELGIFIEKKENYSGDSVEETAEPVEEDNGSSNGVANILIDGTLSADKGVPVLVSDNVTEDNLKLTVWEIVPNKNDNVVELDPFGDSTSEEKDEAAKEEARRALEKSIQYIIRVEDPMAGATVNLGGTTKYTDKLSNNSYDVAHETETVTLKVTPPSGYELAMAYNGEGKAQPLSKDSDGNYYIVVPKGGGVYLSVEFSKLPEEPKKEEPKKEDPKKEEAKKSTSTGSGSSESRTRMGYWRQDAKGWYFQFLGGGYAKNAVINIDAYSSGGYTPGWYGFGEDGYMKTGWALINGNWYFFEQNGLMRTGWSNINGKDYYLNPGVVSTGSMSLPVGALYVNTTTPDGQRVDENGAKI